MADSVRAKRQMEREPVDRRLRVAAELSLKGERLSHRRTRPEHSKEDMKGERVGEDSRPEWRVGLHYGQIQPHGEKCGLVCFLLRIGQTF